MQGQDSRDWWRTGVIYHVYLQSFCDTNGDGIGDLTGVTEKLSYLRKTLGVDALWISPFYPSPMKDFGYDISDFLNVDPTFGTLATSDDLLTEAHRQGLHVIIDYVPNHTSDQHPWFVESRSSRTNAKRDWYLWRDPKPDGSPPNNWVEETGNSVWEWDAHTSQYYLHSHYVSQPDLNWRNPGVQAAMMDVLRFWLDRGVDGFRIDVAHMIMKDPDLRDNPPNPHPQTNPNDHQHPHFSHQLHVYDRQHADLHEVYRAIRKLLDGYSSEYDHVMIGEIEVAPWETWVRYYGTTLDEFHLPFQFQFIETLWEARAVRAFVEAFEQMVPAGAWPNYVMGNHDRPRLATRYGSEAARLAALLLLTLRGTPTLYYGDELGMQDDAIPSEMQHDPLGRDPIRTPMLWNAKPNAGFCPPDSKPWLPLTPNYQVLNVETQLTDPHSLLTLYRRLLAYRRGSMALRRGTYRSLDINKEGCYCYLRTSEEQQMCIVLNFTVEEQTVQFPHLSRGTLVLSTALDREGVVDLASFTLRGYEGVVLELIT